MKKSVCVVGAGPAGMVAGLLLARKGHDVTVLERNEDFAREFRGEVLQPRFMTAMKNCGLLDVIQNIPSDKFRSAKLFSRGKQLGSIDLGGLNPEFPYLTWMTQPNLLAGLAEAANDMPNFRLIFGASVDELLQENGRYVGVGYRKDDADHKLRADVTIGSDGRFSRVRKLGDFATEFHSHRFDVLWFQAKRPPDFDHGADFFVNPSFVCLTLPKFPDLIQCGILLEVNQARKYLRKGTDVIAERLKETHPMFHEFAENLKHESQFTILKATIDRVDQWARDGLVLIGDAAHTCSPIFAIGVTIAVETAVVAAEVIDQAANTDASSLAAIQDRRMDEVKEIQNRQERAAKFGVLNPITRRLIPVFAPAAFGLGLIRRFLGGAIARR